MRGVGGPLLCIGDLLSDVGGEDGGSHQEPTSLSSSSTSKSNLNDEPIRPLDLSQLFQEAVHSIGTSFPSMSCGEPQNTYGTLYWVPSADHHFQTNMCIIDSGENYNQLNEALAGTDHSWTALTLKLCTALETADKLVQSANSNVTSLSEKVGVLESIVKRGDSAVKVVKVMHGAQYKKERPSVGS